jgi:hypothetical protein
MRSIRKPNKEIALGDRVSVPPPDPKFYDLHQNEFIGRVIRVFSDTAVVQLVYVSDQEDNVFALEPERLEIID